MASKEPPKSFAKRDYLQALERDVQERWRKEKIFEQDALAPGEPASTEGKYMATFPYPYMNGRLHLGHSFTYSKAEFAASFNRLLGKHTLLPFAFHCTGMPIKACADKLKREMDEFGNPPVFPPDEAPESEKSDDAAATDGATPAAAAAAATPKEPPAAAGTTTTTNVDPTAHHSKKSKAVAKSGGKAARQWNIMRQLGVPDEEIAKFADAQHWLTYFPPHAQSDLSLFGAGIDWRRAFITTDANPYYDSFVRWQFETLQKLKKVQFGKRYTIWSPLDNQPCMDHERASGEGVGPQEYIGIKIEVPRASQPAKLAAVVRESQRVFLVAATLRPETMYGQTNVWLGPTVEYVAWRALNDEVFITTARAARNFSYQLSTPEYGKVEVLATLMGTELLGLAVHAPLTSYKSIYTLPMMTVDPNKGTGVVTSVPSDSPADYAALRDLRDKPNLREKFKISEAMVLPFEVVPVLNTPEYGDVSARSVVEALKIKSQNDAVLLNEAHDRCYKAGFYSGKMIVGPHAGIKVKDAKPLIRDELVKSSRALPYAEPTALVMSRSGDECVVCLADQWYIDYGEPAWRDLTLEALAKMNMYSDEARNQMSATLGWLTQWACSRTYGLGTRLPWDPQFLIESLSDSTIYMAYYAVAHLLHADPYGRTRGPLGLSATQLTGGVWDAVLLGAPYDPACGVPEASVARMRREFDYWLPFDLRVTGKDLIPNHLAFCLYTHTAIFPPSKWPRGMRANGHMQLNGQPMSKSKGNFLTLYDACRKYSADAVRLALADAGDGLDDANFVEDLANNAILRLYTQLHWTMEMLAPEEQARMRSGALDFADQVLDSAIDLAISETRKACEATQFKTALKHSFFDLQLARDRYVLMCELLKLPVHRDVIRRFMEVQSVLLAIYCPHTAERMWTLLGHTSTVVRAAFPKAKPVNEELLAQDAYVHDLLHAVRDKFKGSRTAPKGGSLFVYVSKTYPEWQQKAIRSLHDIYRASNNTLPETNLGAHFKDVPDLKQHMKKIMVLANELREEAKTKGDAAFALTSPFDELALLHRLEGFVRGALETQVAFYDAADASAPDPEKRRALAVPRKPSFSFIVPK